MPADTPSNVAEPFQHFVDDYLAYLYEAHPTSATLDGIHVHDDLLDDLSRPGDRAALRGQFQGLPGDRLSGLRLRFLLSFRR